MLVQTDFTTPQPSLEKQIQLFQTIIQQQPTYLAVFKPVRNQQDDIIDFTYIIVSQKYADLLNIPVNQLIDHPLSVAFSHANSNNGYEQLLKQLQDTLQYGNPLRCETSYYTAASALWLECHMTCIEESVMMTILDNTALHSQQEALIQSNHELYGSNQALERSNKRLQTLQIIQHSLLDSSLLNERAELAVLPLVYDLIPCQRISYLRFDETTGLAHVDSKMDDGILETQPGISLPLQVFNQEPLRSGQSLMVNAMQSDTFNRFGKFNPYVLGYRSFILVPFFCQQQYLGIFSLFSHLAGFFTNEHLQIVEEVAAQLAIVLHQQQLNEQIRQRNQTLEQQVAERTAQMQELSALQNNILKHTDVGILTTDMVGVINIVNPALERIVGVQAADLLGRYATELFASFILDSASTTESPLDLIPRQLQKTGHFQGEGFLKNARNELIPILCSASLLLDESGSLTGYSAMVTDITKLKQVENQLQEQNQQLAIFFDSSAALHCIINSDGYFIKMNRLWELVLGYSLSELMAKPYFVHPDDRGATVEVINRLTTQIVPSKFINRYRHKDGSYRILEWNNGRKENLFIGSARDITLETRMHKKLRQSNMRLKLATQAANQGIWEYDHKTDILYWNKRMYEIYGRSPARTELGLSDFLSMIHPDDLPNFLTKRTNAFKSGEIAIVMRIIQSNGAIRYVDTRGRVIPDKAGSPSRTIGVAWDVTERVQAEEALRDSEQRFRAIADNVDQVFCVFSPNPSQLLYVNPAYERLWGTSSKALYTSIESLMDGILEEDRPKVMAYRARVRIKEDSIQFRLANPPHNPRWVSARIFIQRDEQGNPYRYIGIVTDISSQKEKETVLQQAVEREQELNKLKSQFVSTVSHEFRTPLMTIQSSADLIGLYLDRPEASAKLAIQNQLSIIEAEIRSFSALLSDILTISQIDSGKVGFHPVWLNVQALCQQVIGTHFNYQANERMVQMSTTGIPCPVFMDDKLFAHILINLLSNAFKFSQSNPRLSLTFQTGELIIRVQDDGIGIPAADQPLLFQAFFRASNTTAIQGTGLGLVISRQFVELHGGTLLVESQEGKGSTFTIVLPIPHR